ncbi:MAG TPA: NADH-quinone oxidoreductase subunit NuoG, partial [Alphaproteobacteria bacterium]|nr:NADH-quinone oxidoreductase subunit NuoG [Alphaproteobacteria bacterium]
MIHIDGEPFEADPDRNVLEVCLGHGFDLPYFCWHPALGSVGACRQCAVKQFKDEEDTDGKLVMSCMLAAADGTRISIEDEEARRFRATVIEWLMTNHPHDCPVCEEGGECHLQDMTVMTGHAYRRYRFAKRTFRNQDLGPFLNHEMNRCITCYRCTRFYREYAGGSDLEAFGVHNKVYFGRRRDGPLENEFSGNLAEVCPTGVFTDRTLGERYTRKWDLSATPSICAHCGLGCNTTANERHGELRRTLNRYNGAVNRYFLCDRGRFAHGFVGSAERIRQPLLRKARDGAAAEVTPEQAMERAAEVLRAGPAVGIGSPRASLEANVALRSLVGAENFHLGLADDERRTVDASLRALTAGPLRTPSLAEIETADAVLLLGEDVTATAPRLALALRQAVRQAAFAVAAERGVPAWQDHSVREAGYG